MAGACENDTVDSNEVGGRLFSLRAFDYAVAGKAARFRQHPGAEHRFLVEQAAVGLEVKDSRRSSDHAHRHPQPVQDKRQGLDALRIGACRQADENLPAGYENVAAIDVAVPTKVNHRIEVFAQSGAGRIAFTETARSARPEDDGRPGHAQRGILHEDRVGPGFERFQQRDLHPCVGDSLDVGCMLAGKGVEVGITGIRCAQTADDATAGLPANRVREPEARFRIHDVLSSGVPQPPSRADQHSIAIGRNPEPMVRQRLVAKRKQPHRRTADRLLQPARPASAPALRRTS